MSGALKRDEWETVRLGDVGEIITGKTPKTSEPENYSSQDICFYKPSDFSDESISVFGESEFYLSNYARPNLKILPPNSVLVTCIGIIGKVGITKHESTCNQQINAIIPNHNLIDSKYLAYAIHKIKHTLRDIANSPVVPIINKSQFSNVTIPLPPLDIQRQIADTLDKVTELIDLRKKQLEKLDELVKARFVELFGSIHDEKFEMKSLPEIVAKDKNAIKRGPFGGALKKEDFVETGYLVYEQRHAIHNDFEYEKYYITKEKYEDMIGFKVVPGDLIISCSGVTLGRIAEVPRGAKEGIINQALLKLSLNQTVMKNTFFIHQFRSEEIQEILFGFSRGSGIPNMPSMNEVKAVKFICPPIEQQEQFTAFVEQTDKSKVIIQQSLDTLETLKKSLMQEYFG